VTWALYKRVWSARSLCLKNERHKRVWMGGREGEEREKRAARLEVVVWRKKYRRREGKDRAKPACLPCLQSLPVSPPPISIPSPTSPASIHPPPGTRALGNWAGQGRHAAIWTNALAHRRSGKWRQSAAARVSAASCEQVGGAGTYRWHLAPAPSQPVHSSQSQAGVVLQRRGLACHSGTCAC